MAVESSNELLKETQEELNSLEALFFKAKKEDYQAFWNHLCQNLQALHKECKSGIKVAKVYSQLLDQFIRHLFNNAKQTYKEKYGAWHHPISLVALGGYGRMELSPNSDLDLMLLYPQKIRPEALERFIEVYNTEVVYPLWDLKIKISDAHRTINQSIEEAKKDFRTRNSQLESRLICGTIKFFNLFSKTYQKYWDQESHQVFIDESLKDQQIRHHKYGDTELLQEPDIKNGMGGLRDYHIICWISRAYFGSPKLETLKKHRLLAEEECKLLAQAHDFLLQTRNQLHFLCNRSTNLLDLERQPQIAWELGISIFMVSDLLIF